MALKAGTEMQIPVTSPSGPTPADAAAAPTAAAGVLDRVIDWSACNVFLVLLATLFLIGGGLYAVRHTPLDALPDLSELGAETGDELVQVILRPGHGGVVVQPHTSEPGRFGHLGLRGHHGERRCGGCLAQAGRGNHRKVYAGQGHRHR